MPTTHNIQVIAYLTPEQKQKLDALSKATRVLKSIYMREAVDDLLAKYKKQLKGGVK